VFFTLILFLFTLLLVFWALRGGGAGSWGVVTTVTVQTYPTFNATLYEVTLKLPSAELVSDVMTAHAQHVFDWEPAGHYYQLGTIPDEGTIVGFSTYFPNTSAGEAVAQMAEFFDEALALGLVVVSNTTTTALANELVHHADDQVGNFIILGSRLIPSAAYTNTPDALGQAQGELVALGFTCVCPNKCFQVLRVNLRFTIASRASWSGEVSPQNALTYAPDLTCPCFRKAVRERKH
jgi:hypothetical protein